MNLDLDFVQVSKLSEDQKKVLTKSGTLFSPNSGEDQKKGLHHFFRRIQVDTYAQMHTRVKLLGRMQMYTMDYSNYWGDAAKLLGDISLIPLGFRHPCWQWKVTSSLLLAYRVFASKSN